MGGFFGAVSRKNCKYDVFFGTDYHSHLGTKRGGLAFWDADKGFQRQIHNIENTPFRTKFENDLSKLCGTVGIGCISDTDPQPLLVRSHLGMYAIATKLLGYDPVTAYDYDPDCVTVTLENMQCNGLTGDDIEVFAADATTYDAPREFDFACVNILSPILCAHAPRIISWVRPDGLLALAGILSQDFEALSKTFTAAGAVELDRFTEKEWTSGLFRRVK